MSNHKVIVSEWTSHAFFFFFCGIFYDAYMGIREVPQMNMCWWY